MYEDKTLYIFDVDGTLAPAWQPISNEMESILCGLLTRGKRIAFATARDLPLLEDTVLAKLTCLPEHLAQVYLLSTAGAAFHVWGNDSWKEVYAHRIEPDNGERLFDAYKAAFRDVLGADAEKRFTFHLVNKDWFMLSIYALDTYATGENIHAWDVAKTERRRIIEILQPQFPHLDMRIGGRTTIDVTQKGINKSFGVRELLAYTHIPTEEVVFTGDEFFEGGNDIDVLNIGIDVVKVTDPDDAYAKLKHLVA